MPVEFSLSDPSSFSRPDVCVVRNLDLSLNIDFDRKILSGHIKLDAERIDENAPHLILDVKLLTILLVVDVETDEPLKYDVSEEVPEFGSKLTVHLPKNDKKNVTIKIEYETSPEATGLQWLAPEQTLEKTLPFLYSQCQPTHARSVLPCQDTPAVKSTYTATISAPNNITVLMSAIRNENKTTTKDNITTYYFEQKIPVPSYLIAIAAGKLESRKIGPRSHIWAEHGIVDKAANEFSETETFLKTAEDICGPYVWGIYDLLVLPPSFPYGGMENPCLTFVTPTIIAGDKSLALVVAHEIAHSWTGNLVTNRNFEHFWLNEGFTVFVERKIAGRMHGALLEDFEAMQGLCVLRETVDKLGTKSDLTKLVLNLKGIHPDSSFSSIPYEKGYIFLRYLQNVVGGADNFETFLKQYLDTYKYKSIDSFVFKKAFIEHFAKDAMINDIDWDKWFYGTGLPPVIPEYNKSLANACISLKDKWISWDENDTSLFTEKDIVGMTANQLDYFLQLLLECEPIPVSKLELMNELYKFDDYTNAEIRFRWIRIGLKAKWLNKVDDALKMVTEVGRMKYIRPLYQDMYKWEQIRKRAINTFNESSSRMMFVSAYTVRKDLQINE